MYDQCQELLGEQQNFTIKVFDNKLEQALKSIIEKEGYIKHEIDRKFISTKNGNYLALLYEVNITGKTKHGEDKELNIFVKKIRPTEDTIKIVSITDVYKTEMFAYKELPKIFKQLQDEVNLPLEKRYKMVKSYEETNTEVIIMENVAKKGFDTYYRIDVASIKFLKMSIEELAKFHGLSFVLKEKQPEYFDKKIKCLKIPFCFGEHWLPFVEQMKCATIDYVDPKYRDKVEKLYEIFGNKYRSYCDDLSLKVCMCHGDYRPNNIMIRMENGEEQEIVPVDYQMIHYGTPVFDFLFLMYTSTDRAFRKAHMLDLKDFYYESLINFLRHFNLDGNVVYPREEFEKVFKEKLDYGLMITLFYYTFFFAAEDDEADMKELKFKLDDRFGDRLNGVIQEFVEWGFI